jgi:hypothetical protein
MGNPLGGYRGDVWVSATPSVLAASETCNDSGDHITYNASVHFFWDDTQPLVIQCSPNGSTGWVTVTDYVFLYPVGRLIFNTARVVATNNFVKILSGYYVNATQLDLAHDWSLSGKGNAAITTAFAPQATPLWVTRTGTTRDVTGKISTWRTDDRIYKELGNRLLVQLWVDKPNNVRWQFFAYALLDIKADIAAALTQDLVLEADGDVYYLTT